MCRRLCTLVTAVIVLGSVLASVAGAGDPTLVGWWKCDEGAGTTAQDSSGYGNDGAFSGDPQWGAGYFGKALEFDGSDDCLYCGNDASLDLTTWTVTFWLNVAENKNYSGFVIKGLDAAENYEVLGFADGSFHFPITFTDGTRTFVNTAVGTIVVGEWAHFAYSYDSAEGRRLYKDGSLVFDDTESGIPQASTDPLAIGNERPLSRYVNGTMDDIRIYSRVLTPEELSDVMLGRGPDTELAGKPSPADEATDVPRDTVLAWEAGEFTATHDVYLGVSFDDVNDASRVSSMDVLLSQEKTAATYGPEDVFEYGQTYYWRVDEVNGAPDNMIFKGETWSFTVEPLAYPIEAVIATSNATSEAGAGPENTVNGSGLNTDDQHSTDSTDMFVGVPGADPMYIQYEFDRVYKLDEMLAWNYNVQFELMLGFGLKDVMVEYSEDGADWTVLGDVELAQATARADYAANTAIDFGGVAAKYVRLTVNSGYGPLSQFGLSEVRFMYVPVSAREPHPAAGDTGVAVGTVLSWRAGREAVSHEVYLSTDPNALALVGSVSQTSYVPGNLEFGSTYYWRIDEVNEADEISVWTGVVWDFMTREYAIIDDMESYDDEDNRIYDTWLDGWVNETGSTVGYLEAPFAEKTVVNSGTQSMPLAYDNSAAPFYSEAEKDLGDMKLTGTGADSLRLFVSGLAPGFAENADGTILMNGIGTDIWNTGDQFRFAYKSLAGNGSMIARVDSLDTSTDVWVKAGVMIRQGTGTGSQHSFMPITGSGGNGASWQGRTAEGLASVNQDATSPVAVPYWVRIDRSGNSLTGFISADGQTWTQIGDPRTVMMTDPVLIGLALTSHNANQATSVQFSNVGITGNVTGSWKVAEIGVAQPVGNTPAPVYVALEDSTGKVAVVNHPDPALSARSGWTEWVIPYTELSGINLGNVRTMYVGVGNRNNPTSGGTGTIFVDDIGYGRPAVAQ